MSSKSDAYLRVSAIDSNVTVTVRTRAQGCAGVRDIDKNRPAKRADFFLDILLFRQMVQGAGSEIRDENLKKHKTISDTF